MVDSGSDRHCEAVWTEWAEIMGQDMKSFRNAAKLLGLRTGGIVTYEGVYIQATKAHPNNKIAVPFAIAQTPEEIKKMQLEELLGIIAEADCFSTDRGGIAWIDGKISRERVAFEKQYLDEPRDRVIIHYEGTMQTNGAYQGRWNFNEPEDGIVIPEGDFFMLRVQ